MKLWSYEVISQFGESTDAKEELHMAIWNFFAKRESLTVRALFYWHKIFCACSWQRHIYICLKAYIMQICMISCRSADTAIPKFGLYSSTYYSPAFHLHFCIRASSGPTKTTAWCQCTCFMTVSYEKIVTHNLWNPHTQLSKNVNNPCRCDSHCGFSEFSDQLWTSQMWTTRFDGSKDDSIDEDGCDRLAAQFDGNLSNLRNRMQFSNLKFV